MSERKDEPVTYSHWVNYGDLDPFKIRCQQAAATTGKNIERFGRLGLTVHEVPESRGESAYRVVIERVSPVRLEIAHVEEGIGTKNVVAMQLRESQSKLELAEEMRQVFGRSFYRASGIDNAATILNDLSSCGASPISFLLHVAAGHSDWFKDEERNADLIDGTLWACNEAGCAWGGGETPALRDIINEGHSVLSGSAWGLIKGYGYDYRRITEGNRIVLIGIPNQGANGITLIRNTVRDRLSKGWETMMSDGRSFGEAVLEPTPLYSPLVDKLNEKNVPVNYAANMSGHAWRKLMRPPREFSYVIHKLPEVPELFHHIKDTTGMTLREMYGDYTMGAGYAFYVDPEDEDDTVRIAEDLGYPALRGGVVEKGPKRVVLPIPDGIFTPEDLQIR